MMIHEVTPAAGRYKARKRIGRGRGSGHGKTSGRGHKGAGSRSGYSQKTAFEGGQMPYFRRIPKRGFTNVQFTTRFWIVNIRDIVASDQFSKGGDVTSEALVRAGLIRDASRPVKVLGDLGKDGSLGVKLKITVERVSAQARQTIEAAGGTVNETGTRRDKVRGVDRNTPGAKPANLTKKLRRSKRSTAAQGKKQAAESEEPSE